MLVMLFIFFLVENLPYNCMASTLTNHIRHCQKIRAFCMWYDRAVVKSLQTVAVNFNNSTVQKFKSSTLHINPCRS
uniref:Secreted protein n=1 Tax=Physcomitrium patens TaxID=3218 RepID=A0A2K1KJU4_PHYPA|nr:hypothetical protein PHYPA_007727 [Physcomitrium patens]